MTSYRMPIVIPLTRPWPKRLHAALSMAWQDWAGWRARTHAARLSCRLSDQVLDDVGAPEDWRMAAAHCRARDAMERSLLRMGVVSGVPW